MTTLPNTLEEAIAQSQQATRAAIADGLTRLQVELVFPELKMMPVAQQFVAGFEERGDRLRVYFPDPGAAALARRDWGEKPYAIRGINDIKAEMQPDEELLLFIEPSSIEVGDVEKLCEKALNRAVVFLNPRLEDVATIGIGYAGRQLRERFFIQFQTCYYIRALEGAALFRCYPDNWQVWLEKETGYELVADEPQKPVGEALEQILMKARGIDPAATQAAPQKGLFSGLQQFLRALSQ